MFGFGVLTDVATDNLLLIAGPSVRFELFYGENGQLLEDVGHDFSQCVVGLLDGGVLDFVDQFMETMVRRFVIFVLGQLLVVLKQVAEMTSNFPLEFLVSCRE